MTEQEVLQKIHELNMEMFQELDRICRKYDIQYFFASGALLGALRHQGFIPWDNDIDIWMTRDNFDKLYAHQDELSENVSLVMPTETGKNRYLDTVPRLNYKNMYIKMDEDVCRYYNNHNNRMDLDIFFIDKTYGNWKGKVQRLEMIFVYGLMNAYRHKSLKSSYAWYFKIAQGILDVIGRMIPLEKLRALSTKIATRYDNDPNAHYYFASTDGAAWKNIVPEEDLKEVVYLPFEDTVAPTPNGADHIMRIWFGDYMKLPPKEQQVPHWGQILLDPDLFVFEEPPTWEEVDAKKKETSN